MNDEKSAVLEQIKTQIDGLLTYSTARLEHAEGFRPAIVEFEAAIKALTGQGESDELGDLLDRYADVVKMHASAELDSRAAAIESALLFECAGMIALDKVLPNYYASVMQMLSNEAASRAVAEHEQHNRKQAEMQKNANSSQGEG